MAMRHVLLLCCLALLSGLLIAQWVRSRAATNPAATPSASIAARLRGLREVNYYPARENWANMWISWDAGTIDADFGRLAALHANTVRLIVQTEAFGYPTPMGCTCISPVSTTGRAMETWEAVSNGYTRSWHPMCMIRGSRSSNCRTRSTLGTQRQWPGSGSCSRSSVACQEESR